MPLIQLGFFGGGALLLMIAATSSPILAPPLQDVARYPFFAGDWLSLRP